MLSNLDPVGTFPAMSDDTQSRMEAHLNIACWQDQKERWEEAAQLYRERLGIELSVSAWVRSKLDAEAEKEIKRAKS